MFKLSSQFRFGGKSQLTFLLLFTFLIPTSVVAIADFPPPPESTVEWVGKNLEVNGIQSAIRTFHSRRSIEKVVKFYRKEWERPVGKDMPGFMETIDSAPWYIISRIEDGYLLTVQVQVEAGDSSGSWGYLSRSRLPEKQKGNNSIALGKNTPKMPGSHVLNEMKSNDPGKKASTLIISNSSSVASNVAFYRNHFNSKGWTLETDRSLGHGKVHSLIFKTKRNRTTMMFMPGKKSTKILINSVTNSIF